MFGGDADAEDSEGEGAAGSGRGAGRAPQKARSSTGGGADAPDVAGARDQDAGGRSGSARAALWRSGSLAARRQYAQSVAAQGVCIGVGVATHERELAAHHTQPAVATATVTAVHGEAFAGAAAASGSWGEVGPGPTCGVHGTIQWGSACGAGGRAEAARKVKEEDVEEEDELAHLMCDECDFVTPPHSPKAAARGGWASVACRRVGQLCTGARTWKCA